MEQIIKGKRYNTKTAMLLAHDEFTNSSNRQNWGRNTYLYRTTKGAYFAAHTTCWSGEHDHIEPLTNTLAADVYETLHKKLVDYDTAFPDLPATDA